MDAIKAIEAALRIEDLWMPGAVAVEYEEEAKALRQMRQNFLDVISALQNTSSNNEYKPPVAQLKPPLCKCANCNATVLTAHIYCPSCGIKF